MHKAQCATIVCQLNRSAGFLFPKPIPEAYHAQRASVSLIRSPIRNPTRSPAYSPTVGKGVGGNPILSLIDALKAAGLWDGLDLLYINGGVAVGNAVINLKSPATFDLAPSGGPDFSAKGFSGDGVDAFLSTGYTPTGSGNYS